MSFIKLEHVRLNYLIKTGSDSIKKTAMHILNKCFRTDSRNSYESKIMNTTYCALNDINLHLTTGDRVGILGPNGAGKSTLLRVLAKVYKPDEGKITMQGKISSLFDINLGMNLEATGYENIINLSIMRGFSKKIAYQSIPDIVAFTKLGGFLNCPVRTYSAGMQMKLAFAVATGNASEIILIDEIIGVGDKEFMKKAKKRLENHIQSSHILVLITHSHNTIKRFCNKVLVLDQGEIQFLGDVESGVAYYEQYLV